MPFHVEFSFTFRSCQRLYVLLGRNSRISGFSVSISIIWENIRAEMPHGNMKRLPNGPVYLKGRLFLWSNALLKVNVSGSTTTETVLIVTCVLESCSSFTSVWDFHNNPHSRLSRHPAYQTKPLHSNSLLRARFTSTSINQSLLTGLQKPK